MDGRDFWCRGTAYVTATNTVVELPGRQAGMALVLWASVRCLCSLDLGDKNLWAWQRLPCPVDPGDRSCALPICPATPPCMGPRPGVLTQSPLPSTGITQEKINEMRAAPEQQMIADIHCMIAAGQDLDWIDAQGATLVSRRARRGWGCGVSTRTKTS